MSEEKTPKEKPERDLSFEGLCEYAEDSLMSVGGIQSVIFVCSANSNRWFDLEPYLENEDKLNEIVPLLRQWIVKEKAYRLFAVLGCKIGFPAEDVPEDEIKRIMRKGKQDDRFTVVDGFKIIEVTYDTVRVFIQTYKREGNTIMLGDTVEQRELDAEMLEPLRSILHPLG